MLPDKLSELITLSIKDLTQAEQDPRYKIIMFTWHTPGSQLHVADRRIYGVGESQCAICLAGSVMAFSMNIPPDVEKTPDVTGFPDSDESKLVALNFVRRGSVSSALVVLGRQIEYKYDRLIVPYEQVPALFKTQMLELAEELKGDGL